MLMILIIIAVVVFMAVVTYVAMQKADNPSGKSNPEDSVSAKQASASTDEPASKEEKQNKVVSVLGSVLGAMGFNGVNGGTQANSAQEFIPLDDIRDGVICVHSVTGVPYYRMMIECGSINYALKTDEEQGEVETIFRSAVTSMQFPWGIYVQTRKLDNREFVQKTLDDIAQTVQGYPQLAEYGSAYAKFLTDTMNKDVKNLIVKKKYIVVACNTAVEQVDLDENDKFEWARSQMLINCGIVQNYMRRMGIASHICNSSELLEIMYETMNKKEGGMVDGLVDGDFTIGMVPGYPKMEISDDNLQKIIQEFVNELDTCIIEHPTADPESRVKAMDLRKEAIQMSQKLKPEHKESLLERLNEQ